jgi:hypothetical protein
MPPLISVVIDEAARAEMNSQPRPMLATSEVGTTDRASRRPTGWFHEA